VDVGPERTPCECRKAQALERYFHEASAVIDGELGSDWADHYGPLFDVTEAARAALQHPCSGPQQGTAQPPAGGGASNAGSD
jgi:hypothetical protein